MISSLFKPNKQKSLTVDSLKDLKQKRDCLKLCSEGREPTEIQMFCIHTACTRAYLNLGFTVLLETIIYALLS